MRQSTLIAFLGGALVGAAVALLLAPEKGEDTRNKIKRFITDDISGCECGFFENETAVPEKE